MSIDFQPILIKFFFSDNLILLDQLVIYCIDKRSIGVISLLLFFLLLENFRNLFVLALVCLLYRKNIIICHHRQYDDTASFGSSGCFNGSSPLGNFGMLPSREA